MKTISKDQIGRDNATVRKRRHPGDALQRRTLKRMGPRAEAASDDPRARIARADRANKDQRKIVALHTLTGQ